MLEVRCRADEDSIVIELLGEICSTTAPILARCLESVFDVDALDVVVDLTSVVVFDEAGLQVLARTKTRCDSAGRVFDLRSANATTASILELFEVGASNRSAATLLTLDNDLRAALELARQRMSSRQSNGAASPVPVARSN